MKVRILLLLSLLLMIFGNVQAQFHRFIGKRESEIKIYLQKTNPEEKISIKQFSRCISIGQKNERSDYYIYLISKRTKVCEEIDIITNTIGLFTFTSILKSYEENGQAEKVGADTWIFYYQGNKLIAYYEENTDNDGTYYLLTFKKK